ncbi:MAG: class I SAM-dependent methyltransferase [Pyrinomonadaceae bacterium]
MTTYQTEKFIPALGADLLTPLYDPLLWLMRETRFKTDLVEQAQMNDGSRVLDVGCGTGTLAIMVKKLHPDVEVIGIDADSKILAIARHKAAKAGIKVTLDQGMADQLPYAANSFDRVLSSLFLHHLKTENKLRTLREILRVLRPGGRFDVVDFGLPRSFYSRLVARFTANSEEVAANIKGLLPEIFREAGFENVAETKQFMTVAGALSFYRGQKP